MELCERRADDRTPESIRAQYPELFPAANVEARYLTKSLQRAYIVRDTRLAVQDVEAALLADDEYMRAVGIID